MSNCPGSTTRPTEASSHASWSAVITHTESAEPLSQVTVCTRHAPNQREDDEPQIFVPHHPCVKLPVTRSCNRRAPRLCSSRLADCCWSERRSCCPPCSTSCNAPARGAVVGRRPPSPWPFTQRLVTKCAPAPSTGADGTRICPALGDCEQLKPSSSSSPTHARASSTGANGMKIFTPSATASSSSPRHPRRPRARLRPTGATARICPPLAAAGSSSPLRPRRPRARPSSTGTDSSNALSTTASSSSPRHPVRPPRGVRRRPAATARAESSACAMREERGGRVVADVRDKEGRAARSCDARSRMFEQCAELRTCSKSTTSR